MVLEKSSAGILFSWSVRLSESLQLYQILHPSAAASPPGTGSSRGETNLASMGSGLRLRLVFESETVKLLLPNAPGHCRAGGAQFLFLQIFS